MKKNTSSQFSQQCHLHAVFGFPAPRYGLRRLRRYSLPAEYDRPGFSHHVENLALVGPLQYPEKVRGLDARQYIDQHRCCDPPSRRRSSNRSLELPKPEFDGLVQFAGVPEFVVSLKINL